MKTETSWNCGKKKKRTEEKLEECRVEIKTEATDEWRKRSVAMGKRAIMGELMRQWKEKNKESSGKNRRKTWRMQSWNRNKN